MKQSWKILCAACVALSLSAFAEEHWEYEGKTGPEHWAELDPKFEACKTGHAQSPIDIDKIDKSPEHPIELHYQKSPLTLINTGHTIQVNYAPGSTLVVDGKTYKLLQFHFHTPSEHTVHHKSFPMEMHLVHKGEDGQLGVLAVMVKKGKENRFLKDVWDHFPTEKNKEVSVPSTQLEVAGALPENHHYYHYLGSLTTPPCSENVNWMVLTTPIEASGAQLKKFHALFKKNNRPVQALHDRHVELW
jgi:carbonic anhydrase